MKRPRALGCYVPDTWGHYQVARCLVVASYMGEPVPPHILAAANQHLASMGPGSQHTQPVTGDRYDEMIEALENLEAELPAYHRTWWGVEPHGGGWGHHLLEPESHPFPTVTFAVDIYSHDAEQPDEPIESGHYDPSWSRWATVEQPVTHELPDYAIEQLEVDYTPTLTAQLLLDEVTAEIGGLDHIEVSADPHAIGTYRAVCYAADPDHDYGGARSPIRATYWASRQATIRQLLEDEAAALTALPRLP